MDLLWIVLGCGFMIAGIIGSVVPLVPGPPLSYIGLLVLQLRDQPPFTGRFLLLWLAIVVIVGILDYIVPIYGTKKFGGTKYGIWGCVIGLFVGIWLGPMGIIAGPFIGALLGEVLANTQSEKALKAALGSFIGFVFSTLIKLVTCLVMSWYVVKAL